MTGIRRGDIAIVEDWMPYRKKRCLCVMRGNVITKYATFNNDEAAKEFIEILGEFLQGGADGNDE